MASPSSHLPSLPSKSTAEIGRDTPKTTALPSYLDWRSTDTTLNIYVVVSAHSGSHAAVSYLEETLRPFLAAHSVQYVTHVTESADSVTQLARDRFVPALRDGTDVTAILLSGDGGVVDVVDEVCAAAAAGSLGHQGNTSDSGTERRGVLTLCLVPMGTANALAHSSGVTLANCLDVMMAVGSPKRLPLFKTTISPGARLVVEEGQGRVVVANRGVIYGAVVFSWALHASLVHLSDTTAYRAHGIERFKRAAGELIGSRRVWSGKVSVLRAPAESSDVPEKTEGGVDSDERDGEHWEPLGPMNRHLYILATLVSNLEENFCISPASRPLEGKMWLVALGVTTAPPDTPSARAEDGSNAAIMLPPERVGEILGKAYQRGAHVQDPDVKYEEIEGVKVEFFSPTRHDDSRGGYGENDVDDVVNRVVCIDGKIVEVERGGWVEVRRKNTGGKESRRAPWIDLVC